MSDNDSTKAILRQTALDRSPNGGRTRWVARTGTGLLMVGLAVAMVARAEGAEPAVTATEPAMSAAPASDPSGAAVPRPPLPGQLSARFGIDEARPEDSVPNAKDRDRNPLEYGYFIQDLLERADQAQKNKDYSTVVRYYRAVAKAVPENAKGWSKLCEAYERLHERERAIGACRYAIDRPGVEVHDYVRYVHLIIAQTEPLSAKERQEIGAVLEHLDKQEGVDLIASHLRCEVGVKVQDVAKMEACTKVLTAKAPDDPKTIVFRWTLAMMKGQTAEASRLLVYARATGVSTESVERMQAITPGASGLSRKLALGIGAVVAIAAGAIALVLVSMRRRRALATSRAAT
jgi:hypothetical protein